jgi:hypothetical protein
VVTYYRRSAWTSHGPIRPLTLLDPASVLGMSVHWPGSTGRWGQTPTLAESAARLEAERVQHTSPSKSDSSKPWSDFAYDFACDLAGRVFEGRGIAYRSAANGNATTNSQYVAVTILMGDGDTLTPAAVEAVRYVRGLVLTRYPHAIRVIGHRDLYSTECPGPQAYALVRSGAFASAPEEDNMPTADEVADALLRRVAAAPSTPTDAVANGALAAFARQVWRHPFNNPTPDDPKALQSSGDRLLIAARGGAVGPALDAILGAVRALPAEITTRLPAGAVDLHALAVEVADELAARMKS